MAPTDRVSMDAIKQHGPAPSTSTSVDVDGCIVTRGFVIPKQTPSHSASEEAVRGMGDMPGGNTSRWTDEELLTTICKDRKRRTSTSKGEVNKSKGRSKEPGKFPAPKIVTAAEAENAIESDSEDESNSILPRYNTATTLGYASRDICNSSQPPQLTHDLTTRPSLTVSQEQEQEPPTSVSVSSATNKSNVANDEDEEPPALTLARLKRSYNSGSELTDNELGEARFMEAESQLQASYPDKKKAKLSPLKRPEPVRIIPKHIQDAIAGPYGNIETPVEIKSFERESIIEPRQLHPSKTRPAPTQVILKTLSPPSRFSTTFPDATLARRKPVVRTAIKRGSGFVINGRLVPNISGYCIRFIRHDNLLPGQN